jgi:hypothetical protein
MPASVEGFDVFSSLGKTAVGRACNVRQADGLLYVFRDVGEMWMDPQNPEGCTMRQLNYDDGLLKSDLSDCSSTSVLNDRVVDTVQVQKMMGRDHCVVRIKEGLKASEYKQYELKLRDEAIKRSNRYRWLQGLYDQLVIDYRNMLLNRDQLKVSIKNERGLYNKEVVNHAVEVEKANAIRAAFPALDAQISGLATQIGGLNARIDIANSASDTAQQELKTLPSCKLPAGWCVHPGGKYTREDCHGDGQLVHVCRDDVHTGTIGPKNNCTDTWPNATAQDCPVIGPKGGVCSKTRPDWNRPSDYRQWTDGDRNTAIWLIATLAGDNGGIWQARPNDQVSARLDAVCRGGARPDSRCERACPGWYNKDANRGYTENFKWDGTMTENGNCNCVSATGSSGNVQPDVKY